MTNDLSAIAPLRSTVTVRERCRTILHAVEAGQSRHFTVNRTQLDAVADSVAQMTRHQYPDLKIPYHSRWRHFESGGINRKAQLDAALNGLDVLAKARARIDLTLISVLLDAGAGPDWRYAEADTGQTLGRSEGLGVATFHAFMKGQFSSATSPYQVDAHALLKMDTTQLAIVFQAGEHNPLVGLEGRVTLLHRLGHALLAQKEIFGSDGRPGGLFDFLTQKGQIRQLAAPDLLRALLDYLSSIWLTGNTLRGVPLGDCWQHPLAGGTGPTAGWVPFHKLSQWLTYSLLEPFEWAGIALTELDGLTGLPEYRNGGLLLDAGVIVPREADFATRQFSAGDEAIVEWRALTVALIDELAPRVRLRLGQSAEDMPLACILEGGTWATGRQLARTLREGGPPPLKIASDGTVF